SWCRLGGNGLAGSHRPEDGPGGRPVTAVQFDRQADHLVPAAGDWRQVKPLDDPDPRLEQDLVDPGPVGVIPADGQVVDPDGLHPRLRQVHGGLLGQAHEVLHEAVRVPAADRVRGPEQHAFPPWSRCLPISPAVISRGCSISITRASPIVAVSGISSSPAAPWMKCTGPSMCVPLCTPMARWETLQTSPRPVSRTRCSTIGGLSGQCGMPCRTVTDTSIQSVTSAGVMMTGC